ncbi:hypothetical protein EVAR_11199_1 [Eumeta japonica]|uniref:Uncharacterized protein n=1 Tax=Eumeta variegata TaxID=151549 RepID=A0A4C1U4I4_EUMVA|nr:hypothetical protein EVAR_11199_1 [Eumeta japonica]
MRRSSFDLAQRSLINKTGGERATRYRDGVHPAAAAPAPPDATLSGSTHTEYDDAPSLEVLNFIAYLLTSSFDTVSLPIGRSARNTGDTMCRCQSSGEGLVSFRHSTSGQYEDYRLVSHRLRKKTDAGFETSCFICRLRVAESILYVGPLRSCSFIQTCKGKHVSRPGKATLKSDNRASLNTGL